MSDSLTPDLVRAVRAGCNWLDGAEDRCDYPDCGCIRDPGLLRAALAELETPSDEMLAAVPDYRHLADHCWRAMMRKVLGGES